MARPGYTDSQGAVSITALPSHEHVAPTGCWGCTPSPRKLRLDSTKYGPGNAKCSGYQHGRKGIGQDVPKQYARSGCASQPRGIDKFAFAQGKLPLRAQGG